MATKSWVGSQAVGGDDWNDAANWDPAVVPVAGEDVEIMDSDNAIAAYDNSAVDLGNVNIGPGFVVDIADSGPNYLILSFQANKRLTIAGAPALTSQAMFIEINSANSTTIDLVSYGIVTEAGMVLDGVHLKGTANATKVTNNGGPLTLDSGGFGTLNDTSIATDDRGKTKIESGVNVTSYISDSSASSSKWDDTPNTLMNVHSGTVTSNSDVAILLVNIDGGNVLWNGGAAIGTLLTVYSGVFDTSNADKQCTIAAIEIFGDVNSTLVDLSFAKVTGNITIHGSPHVIYQDSSKQTLS